MATETLTPQAPELRLQATVEQLPPQEVARTIVLQTRLELGLEDPDQIRQAALARAPEAPAQVRHEIELLVEQMRTSFDQAVAPPADASAEQTPQPAPVGQHDAAPESSPATAA